MNAARSLPVLDLLAANDNALDDDGLLRSNPRARAAIAAPLHASDALPHASCRRWHEIRGERVLSSIVALEWYGGAPRWRASVTVWGRANDERREVAELLAQQLLSGLGDGATTIEQSASTTILRRRMSPRERAAATRSRLAVAPDA